MLKIQTINSDGRVALIAIKTQGQIRGTLRLPVRDAREIEAAFTNYNLRKQIDENQSNAGSDEQAPGSNQEGNSSSNGTNAQQLQGNGNNQRPGGACLTEEHSSLDREQPKNPGSSDFFSSGGKD